MTGLKLFGDALEEVARKVVGMVAESTEGFNALYQASQIFQTSAQDIKAWRDPLLRIWGRSKDDEGRALSAKAPSAASSRYQIAATEIPALYACLKATSA